MKNTVIFDVINLLKISVIIPNKNGQDQVISAGTVAGLQRATVMCHRFTIFVESPLLLMAIAKLVDITRSTGLYCVFIFV